MVVMLVWIGVEYMRVEESFRQLRLSPRASVWTACHRAAARGLAARRAARDASDDDPAARAGLERGRPGSGCARSRALPRPCRYCFATQVAGLNGRPDEAARALGLACKLNTERVCEQVYLDWAELQTRHPELRAIAAVGMPSTPAH
jgi:hypothetical protein